MEKITFIVKLLNCHDHNNVSDLDKQTLEHLASNAILPSGYLLFVCNILVTTLDGLKPTLKTVTVPKKYFHWKWFSVEKLLCILITKKRFQIDCQQFNFTVFM